ncbi:MAG TPA: 30S ribosomal protein S17 [Nitrospiria bacterium]|nr:30S ribosomal protein S17 [Nitrospiria bacterium]
MTEKNDRMKKTLIGKVISNKMAKTAVVEIERTILHPKYKKVVKRFTRLKAHDQENRCRVGDAVKIIETRPLSKDKHWLVIDVLSSAHQKLKPVEAGE